MSKLVKFEETSIEMITINGVPMFELYSVGAALGYVVTGRGGKLYANRNRIDRICKNADISAGLHGVNHYLTESQIYDLMLEAHTDKCRTFRKWLTNEVLPELNKTGSYSINKGDNATPAPETYEYFDKKYKGEYVLTGADISYLTGVTVHSINWYSRNHLQTGTDVHNLIGDTLKSFKSENPKIHKLVPHLLVFTKTGFEKICKAFNVKVETPMVFIETKADQAEKPKTEYAVVIGNPRIEDKIDTVRKQMTAVDVLLSKYYRHNITMADMTALQNTLRKLGVELGVDIESIARERVGVTTTYKY